MQTFVVVVDSHGHHFLRILLSNDVFIEIVIDLKRAIAVQGVVVQEEC